MKNTPFDNKLITDSTMENHRMHPDEYYEKDPMQPRVLHEDNNTVVIGPVPDSEHGLDPDIHG